MERSILKNREKELLGEQKEERAVKEALIE